MKPAFLILIIAALFASGAHAEPRLSDLAFMEGGWRGEDNGTVFEDRWTGPEAGVMLGLFKLRTGDRFNVAEFMVVAEEDDDVILRFMHFRPDYTTWEQPGAPNTLRLTGSSGNDALFEATSDDADVRSMRFKLTDDGELEASVSVKKQAPEKGLDEFSFTYRRQ